MNSTRSRGWRGNDSYGEEAPDFREPGTRRRKFAGYLKAANELRQTYQQSYRDSWAGRGAQADGANDMPGAFPGAITATSGHDQLVIFPSYARRHVKQKPNAVPGSIQELLGSGRDSSGECDAEFWKKEWDKYEDDNAIVDVDVRGWIYAPHRGPLSRRSRLMVGLARQLSGIPAPRSSPSSASNSRSSSPSRLTEKLAAHNAKHEDEQAAKEADSIIKRGEAEARVARQGGYSETPGDSRYDSSNSITPSHSPNSSVSRSNPNRSTEEAAMKPPHKQPSWNNPAQMSQPELVEANAQMMRRLQPFLATPRAELAISAFFYNATESRQKTVETDAQGHFSFRAALNFVPTHVRILVSESLSVTEEVLITEPHGVSVISDIDDTIKHSAIGMGARETFRNVFIRDIGQLSIEGVKNWYNALADKGCTFHYVSNAPWQLYPLLTSFFVSAGLPHGSFHLKQYSGVFQGIFEPVAERKKGTLDKISMDFPSRRFILVGDSGEADLEVYTDFVVENPGRVLGVFIRDVTTTVKPGFFDPVPGPASQQKFASVPDTIQEGRKFSVPHYTESPDQETDFDFKEAVRRSLADIENDPTQRRNTAGDETRSPLPDPKRGIKAPQEEKLIDFDSEECDTEARHTPKEDSSLQSDWLQPPPRPAKPRSLSGQSLNNEKTVPKPAPQLPRKPSTSVKTPQSSVRLPHKPLRLHRQRTGDDGSAEVPTRPELPPQRQSYRAAARSKLDSAYNKLPSPTSLVFGSRSSSHSREHSVETGDLRRDVTMQEQQKQRPPVPPRKPLSYTGMAAQSIHNMYSSAVHNRSSDSLNQGYGSDGATTGSLHLNHPTSDVAPNKKEEAWARRWATAQGILNQKGVVLKSWRVGEDAKGLATALVESALEEDARHEARRSARG